MSKKRLAEGGEGKTRREPLAKSSWGMGSGHAEGRRAKKIVFAGLKK